MRTNNRYKRSAVAVVALLTSCASQDSSAQSGSAGVREGFAGTPASLGDGTACSEEHVGGTLTIGDAYELQSLDPASAAGWSTVMQQVYSTLMRFDPVSNSFEPLLAETLSANADSTVWTLQLRKGGAFADGTPLDAAAVVASIERHRAEGTQSPLAARVRTLDMTIVDDRTVEFTLPEAWTEFPWLLSGQVGMITNPKLNAADLVGAPPASAGAGAFKVSNWVPGNELVLSKQEQWWDGPVCLDTVRVVAMPVAGTRKDAFDKGEVQMYVGTAELDVSQAVLDEGVPFVKSFLRLGFKINAGIGSNAGTTPTKDVRVRKALQMGLNSDVMVQRTTGGSGDPSTAVVAPGSRINDGLEGIVYNPDAAKKLVEEVKSEGWNGKLVVATLNVPSNLNIANQATAQLKNIGIESEVVPMELSQYIQATAMRGGGYDIIVGSAGTYPPDECLSCDIGSYTSTSALNNTGFSNEKFDALEATANVTPIAEQVTLMQEYQSVWNDTVPSLLYGHQYQVFAWNPSVRGVTPARSIYFDLSKAWIE